MKKSIQKLCLIRLRACNAYNRRTIHPSLFLRIDEEICERWNKWQAVADKKVFPLEFPQLSRIVLVEEG